MSPRFERVDLPTVCLDGSPAAFYYRRPIVNATAAKWVFFFEGGGWCYSPLDCAARTAYTVGSSFEYPTSSSAPGGGSGFL